MLTDLRQLVALDARVNEASLAVVGMVAPGDLGRPTPCAEWTLYDLVAHMTVQHHGFAAAARGDGADESVWQVRSVADDPVGRYASAAADVSQAFAGVSEGTRLALPELSAEATFPAVQAVTFHLVDGIAHTWDVARAIGVPVDLDTEVLEAGWEVVRTIPAGDDVRLVPGAPFGPPVSVGDDAPVLDRVVAGLGRVPDWSPPAEE